MRRLALLALLCGCTARSVAPRAPAVLSAGDAALAIDADHGALVLSRNGRTLLTFGLDAFQLGRLPAPLDLRNASYDPYWLEPAAPGAQPVVPAGLAWRAATAMQLVSVDAHHAELALTFDGATATLTLSADAPGRFSAKWVPSVSAPAKDALAWYRLRPQVDGSEQFYGLGEWGDSVTHRGKQRPMQIELDALESGYNEAHVPIPLLIGTRGWGLFVASRRAGLFDVARKDPERVEATFAIGPALSEGLAFHLFAADPLDVTKLYEDVAGAPGLPAPWALGPMMWRNESRDQAQVEDDAAQLRARHLAASGYWIDRPYASGVNTFDFNPAKFTDAPAAIQALQAAGLRVALWHAPYVAPAGKSEAAPELNDIATAQGYFPPTYGILLNSWSPPIDFTNAAAVAWWQGLLGQYTGVGIEGFKLDFAEDVQLGLSGLRDPWRFADGSDERTMQSLYTGLYHATYAQLLPSAGGFLLCRAGRWGDEVHGCIIWPGDLEADFSRERDVEPDGALSVGGLPAAMVKGIGLGASGYPFYASDTGGYRNAPGTRLCAADAGPCAAAKELFLRWTEMSALGTAMEVGNASSNMPWEYSDANGLDDSALAIYQRYASLALRLFPYKWTYAQALARDGRAIQRPVGLAFPQMEQQPSDEFLLGDALFAAPVVTQGQELRELVLPPGDWLDWWTGARFSGGDVGEPLQAIAGYDTLPLFIRAGALVPMLRPEIDTLAPATQPGVESYANDPGLLYVRVAPDDAASTFTLFDGTQLSQQRAADGQHLPIAAAATPAFRSGTLFEVIGTAAPAAVSANGHALLAQPGLAALKNGAGWFWEPSTGGTLWIRVEAGSADVAAE